MLILPKKKKKKTSLTETSKIMFFQISGQYGLAKLTHKSNRHGKRHVSDIIENLVTSRSEEEIFS